MATVHSPSGLCDKTAEARFSAADSLRVCVDSTVEDGGESEWMKFPFQLGVFDGARGLVSLAVVSTLDPSWLSAGLDAVGFWSQNFWRGLGSTTQRDTGDAD